MIFGDDTFAGTGLTYSNVPQVGTGWYVNCKKQNDWVIEEKDVQGSTEGCVPLTEWTPVP